MRRLDQDRDQRQRGGAAGFTLIELLVVIAIIGLIIALVLVAAADGVRRAEERATQALITKIETGLNDRLDALLGLQAPINQTHRYLAAINYKSDGTNYVPVVSNSGAGSEDRRAQTIAQFDFIRAELPDVFFVNANTTNGGQFASSYPLNFCAPAYADQTGSPYTPYALPLGNFAPGLPRDINGNLVPNNVQNPPKLVINPYIPPPVSGMFGASFSAAGGIYKNLYDAAISDLAAANTTVVANPPQAYDGVDNNGNGYIDEMAEASTDQNFVSAVTSRLAKHTHKTARSEMLYALLVEGVGPLGSVYNRDEFTAREVQDTDGDGLPEFVDAWGEPLVFFRWPIYFGGQSVGGSSDLQKGSDAYGSYPETRELDPLDTNQLLVSPGWWSSAGNQALTTSPFFSPYFSAPGTPQPIAVSQGAIAFMNYFHILVDPNPFTDTQGKAVPNATPGQAWDRTGSYARREYFSKFLVLSAGPDHEPGVAQYGKNYDSLTGITTDPSGLQFIFPFTNTMDFNAQRLSYIENQASQSDPYSRTGSFFEFPAPNGGNAVSQFLQNNVGLDDISNHNIQAPSTGVR